MASTKREDIEAAALQLFATRGFHGTSVPDLASAAGVGAGTIYRHFDSKEGVVNALYQRWTLQLGEEVYSTTAGTSTSRARPSRPSRPSASSP